MDLASLQTELESYEADASLAEDVDFVGRARALDLVRLLEELGRSRRTTDVARLIERAVALRTRLEAIDRHVVVHFITALRDGSLRGQSLRAELDRFTAYRPGTTAIQLGYDGLDYLLDGALQAETIPDASDALPSEMVHYEPSSARVLLNLVDRLAPGPGDVFYDLGSGDGRIPLLVHLLTGARAVGIEIQPALCAHAERRARELGVSNVVFRNQDAREADYVDATILYLFTPFRGPVLDAALERVRATTRSRRLTVCTFGPCTRQVATRPWLQPVEPDQLHDFRLAVFREE